MALPDINQLDLANEFVDVPDSASGDEFFSMPLADDGEHIAVLKLGQKGITSSRQWNKEKQDKSGPAFLNVHLVSKLLDDQGEEKLTVFDNPTSIVMSNGTSKLHAIMDVAGHKISGRISLADIQAHVEEALAQTPRAKVYTQWEASSKAETADEFQKAKEAGFFKGNDRAKVGDYYTFRKGQKTFDPILDADGQPTGRFNPEATNPITGAKVRAQVRAVRYGRV